MNFTTASRNSFEYPLKCHEFLRRSLTWFPESLSHSSLRSNINNNEFPLDTEVSVSCRSQCERDSSSIINLNRSDKTTTLTASSAVGNVISKSTTSGQ